MNIIYKPDLKFKNFKLKDQKQMYFVVLVIYKQHIKIKFWL